ncbi:MAG: hypothetical protein KGJ35_00785 [Patescibacteria group bacterium]|nr:hypothetical protein [Patescibacteria group bacterium]
MHKNKQKHIIRKLRIISEKPFDVASLISSIYAAVRDSDEYVLLYSEDDECKMADMRSCPDKNAMHVIIITGDISLRVDTIQDYERANNPIRLLLCKPKMSPKVREFLGCLDGFEHQISVFKKPDVTFNVQPKIRITNASQPPFQRTIKS